MNVKSFTYEGFEVARQPVAAYDATKVMPAIAAPAPRPTFSTEELELAKTLARDEGSREGYEKAKQEFDALRNNTEMQEAAQRDQMFGNINLRLNALIEESINNKQKFSERLGQLAIAIARKVSGDISDKLVEAGILEIVKDSISKLDTLDKVKIVLSPRNAEGLNDKFTGAEIIVDEKMNNGDFKLEWQNGYAERDMKKLWELVGNICSRHSSLEENEFEELNITKGE